MKITGACGARRVHARNRLKGCTCISAGLQSRALHLDVINQPMDSWCAAELGTAEEKVLSGGGRILIASGRAAIGNRCWGWGQLWKQGWPRVPLQQTASRRLACDAEQKRPRCLRGQLGRPSWTVCDKLFCNKCGSFSEILRKHLE